MTTRNDGRAYYRRGQFVRAFTAREDMTIEGLRIAGWSLAEIACFVGRGNSTVQARLHTLAQLAEDA